MNEAPAHGSPTASRPHELGILLVHGIGRQRQGDTLRSFGLPLSRWLERWLSHPERTWLEAGVTSDALDEWALRKKPVQRDQLRSLFQGLWTRAGAAPVHGDGSRWQKVEDIFTKIGYPTISARVGFHEATPEGSAERSSATLNIRLMNVKSGLEECQWLVAESWWASAFRPPTYWELLRWGFTVVPWAVVAHFARRVVGAFADIADTRTRSGPFEWGRLIIAALWLAASPVVALVTMITLIMLGVPALTKVPVIGSWVEDVQRTLVETIGDSFVFTRGEIDTAQIRTPIIRDLKWLVEQCEKVAVIAHSQGAAVAYDVLLERALQGDRPIDLLLTFGSGLRKLYELRTTQATAQFGYKLGWMVVLGLTLGLLATFGPLREGPWSVALDLSGLTLGIAGIGPIFMLVTADSPELFREIKDSQRHSRSWEDLYASHDPVPNGKLFVASGAPLVSRKVYNRASVCTDHTTYWNNFDHFVGRVIQELGRLSDLRSSIDEERLAETTVDASLQREWRVGWLQLGRAVVSLLLVGVAWRSAQTVPLLLSQSFPLAGGPVLVTVGILGSGITMQLAYLLVQRTWHWWDRSDAMRLFAREPYEDRCAAFLFFAVVLGTTIGLGAAAILFPWTREGIASMLPLGFGVGLLLGLLVGLVGPSLRSKRSRVRAKQTRRRGAREYRP